MNLLEKVSVLICSCDSYEDLWYPFFTLYKKYWTIPTLNLYLNTETKEYSYDGLNINCIHSRHKEDLYGARMIHALSQIDTEYVIPLLDDFFLRKPVDSTHIERIIEWMENDKTIVCFNQDCLETDFDWDTESYSGYKRLPPGTDYTLNMQAAVWRRKKLIKYWKKKVSPWEWELYSNVSTFLELNDKFYGVTTLKNSFCDYGFNREGMGVFRGKWVEYDVIPLFSREGILVDYSKRGFYQKGQNREEKCGENEQENYADRIYRCLGKYYYMRYLRFCKQRKIKKNELYSTKQFYRYLKKKGRGKACAMGLIQEENQRQK